MLRTPATINTRYTTRRCDYTKNCFKANRIGKFFASLLKACQHVFIALTSALKFRLL